MEFNEVEITMDKIKLLEGHKYKLVEMNPIQLKQFIQENDDDTFHILSHALANAKLCCYFDLTTNEFVMGRHGLPLSQPLSMEHIQDLLNRHVVESFEPFGLKD